MRKTIVVGLMGLVVVSSARAACNLAGGGTEITVTIKTVIPPKWIFKSSDFPITQTLTAEASGGTDSNLKWKFGKFSFPDGDTGKTVKAKQQNWPTSGSFFGAKKVELEYDDAGNMDPNNGILDCKASKNIKLLFPPTQDIGGTPAWFKYWSYKAVPELSLRNYTLSSKSSLGAYAGSIHDAWGGYKSSFWISFMPNVIPSDFDFEFTGGTFYIAREAYEGGGNLNNAKKIDNVAEVVEAFF